MTSEIDMLLKAVIAEPLEDAPRCALADEMQAQGCWNRETLMKWVLQYKAADGPRLALAAFLESEGQGERAEFIRVQCELEPLRGVLNGPEWLKYHERRDWLEGRERVLLDAIGYYIVNTPRVWPVSMTLGRASTTPGDDDARLGIRRGFVAWWMLTAADWLAHADAILAEHPLDRVTLTTRPELPAGEWRRTPPHVNKPWQLTVAGTEIDVPPRPWPYSPGEPYLAGRTDRWYAAILALRWPGVTFTLPPPGDWQQAAGHILDAFGAPPADAAHLTETAPGEWEFVPPPAPA